MLCLVELLCSGSFCLPSNDVEGGYQWEVQTPNGWTPYWEVTYALTATVGGALGHGVTSVLSRVLSFAYHLFSAT
jgi:hypothetical protein